MGNAYEEAVAALFRAPLGDFIATRKQLAAELKAAGDREASAQLLKLARPTLSVWAVNQLWWSSRPTFERLLEYAQKLRAGDRSVAAAHREVLSMLRNEAATLLAGSGHAAADLTLRRVSTNLAAIAANGGFEPDLPGALSGDREPPGFESMEAALAAASSSAPQPPGAADRSTRASQVLRASPRSDAAALGSARPMRTRDRDATSERLEEARAEEARRAERAREAQRAEERRRAELEREQKREEQRRLERERKERARARERERQRVSQALQEARSAIGESEREVARRRTELEAAEARLSQKRTRAQELEARLAELGRANEEEGAS